MDTGIILVCHYCCCPSCWPEPPPKAARLSKIREIFDFLDVLCTSAVFLEFPICLQPFLDVFWIHSFVLEAQKRWFDIILNRNPIEPSPIHRWQPSVTVYGEWWKFAKFAGENDVLAISFSYLPVMYGRSKLRNNAFGTFSKCSIEQNSAKELQKILRPLGVASKTPKSQ